MSERDCGGCTLCCKLLAVEAFDKPANVWCAHCQIGQGCAIYETRPSSCRGFACAWRLGLMGEDLRPDKTHCVVTRCASCWKAGKTHLVCTVDPHRPDAWKADPELHAWLAAAAALMPVEVVAGPRRFHIDANAA